MLKNKENMARLKSELNSAKQELQHKELELKAMLQRIEELTIVDPLTGLFNYNYFNLQAPQILARAKRNKSSICVVLCTVNPPILEHLQHLAHCLQTETRDGQDSVYHLENEFLVLMEQSAENSGRAMLERVQNRFSNSISDSAIVYGIASISWKDLASTLDDVIKTAADRMHNYNSY